jgi:hypothetical protein
MATYSDNFQRANENPLATPWVWDGGYFQLLNNLIQPQFGASNGYGGAYMYYGPVIGDQFSQVTVKTINANSYAGVMVRATTFNGASAWYQFHFDGPLGTEGYLILEKYLGNTGGSYLSYALSTVNSGDVLKLTAVGNVLTAYVNGAQVLQATDSDFKTGWFGAVAYAGNVAEDAQISAWSGGDISSSNWANIPFVSVPGTPTSSGTPGQAAYDSTYVYVCTAKNLWKRALISSL